VVAQPAPSYLTHSEQRRLCSYAVHLARHSWRATSNLPLDEGRSSRINADEECEQGYDADRPDIDLLRLRNYTIGRKLDEAEVVGPHGLDRIAELLSCMKPFVSLPTQYRRITLC